MEKLISNELTKIILVLAAAVVGLSVLMSKLMSKAKAAFKPYRKATLLYLLITMLFCAIIALGAYPSLMHNPMTGFIIFQLCFLLLGSAHAYLLPSNLKWSNGDRTLYIDMVFTLVTGILGSIVFMLVYHWINPDGMATAMMASSIVFIVPWFFYQSYRKAIAIPPKIVKEWFYPVTGAFEEPDDSKMRNMIVISFEFPKKLSDGTETVFKARAPKDMDFGELFYFFINDYNLRHPQSQIEYIDGRGDPYGWVFYKKKSFLTKYVDADKSVFNNHIREDDIITCVRTGAVKQLKYAG